MFLKLDRHVLCLSKSLNIQAFDFTFKVPAFCFPTIFYQALSIFLNNNPLFVN